MIFYTMFEAWAVSMLAFGLRFAGRAAARADADWLQLTRGERR